MCKSIFAAGGILAELVASFVLPENSAAGGWKAKPAPLNRLPKKEGDPAGV